MKVGKVKNKKLKYKFPLGETATGKYVIAVLDADNSIKETNESNNNIHFGPIP
jgi:subtilase family serine protease